MSTTLQALFGLCRVVCVFKKNKYFRAHLFDVISSSIKGNLNNIILKPDRSKCSSPKHLFSAQRSHLTRYHTCPSTTAEFLKHILS